MAGTSCVPAFSSAWPYDFKSKEGIVSLVFDSGQNNNPGTHVLAIGVGRYPHLLRGDGRLAAKPLGLRQLDSPPVSVRAISEWFLAPVTQPNSVGFINSAAPIATLHALASASESVTLATPNGPVALEAATRSNIDAAFASWLRCLKRNDGNVGVFYFCGHGLMLSDHYLLAEDFGGNDLQPWAAAFDISSTIRAVEREVKGALYFFLDACREVSQEIALSVGANPSALMAADLRLKVSRSSLTRISATGEGQLAFAEAGGHVSRFTKALIQSLSGFAGIKAAGQAAWDVDGETLASAIRKILEYDWEKAKDGKGTQLQLSEQIIHGRAVPLIRLNFSPKVAVEVTYSPETKRALYELYLQSAVMRVAQTQLDKPFEVDVPMGIYSVGAVDPAGILEADVRPNEDLRPPRYNVVLGTPS